MARFKFTALDSKGKEVHGEIEAENQTVAISRIREKQYFPTKVEELSGAAASPPSGRLPRAARLAWKSACRNFFRVG